MASPPGLLRLHHFGFVVASIAESMPGMLSSLGAGQEGPVIYDPIQKVRVAFLRPVAGDESLIELVEPAGDDSPVRRFLDKSGGMHHACYEVADIAASLAAMRERKCTVLSQPKPAVAFGGRRIAWVMTRERFLVELLERDGVKDAA